MFVCVVFLLFASHTERWEWFIYLFFPPPKTSLKQKGLSNIINQINNLLHLRDCDVTAFKLLSLVHSGSLKSLKSHFYAYLSRFFFL